MITPLFASLLLPYDRFTMKKIYTSRKPYARFIVAIALALTLPAQAWAKDLHLRYEAYWGGLHIADFTLSLLNGEGTFENRFHLESRGVTRFFTNLSAKATSRGHVITPPPTINGHPAMTSAAALPQADTLVAETYRTEYTNRKHMRWVDIAFGGPGIPAEATTGTSPTPGYEDNWDAKDKGPEILEKVEAEFRTGVNDPISVVPQIIAIVKAHLHGGPESGVARGFDGRRRFDMGVLHLGQVKRTIAGTVHDTYRVRITPNPVAGFKNRHKTLWNNAPYDFYLSRDGDFAPLQIVPVKNGPVLTLVARCDTECDLPKEED